MNRRQWIYLLGAWGAGAALAKPMAGQSNLPGPVSYEEMRAKLARTKLFLIPHAHNDYGWLNSHLWDRARLALVHKQALEIMGRENEFKWFLDVKFEALDPFLERYPEMLEQLQQRVKEGRFGIEPGSFCNPDNPFVEPETMIRNLAIGRREFEKLFPGVSPVVAVFNDIHPGHTQVPQLIRQAGYRSYRFTRPIGALDKKGYKREFIWEGLDGSEILASYGPYAWQGTDLNEAHRQRFEDINNYQADWKRAAVAFYESALMDLLPASPSGMIYAPLGMDYGLPLRVRFGMSSDETYLDFPGFIREWRKRESIPLNFATPADYFGELEKVRSTLPRVKGVIDPVGWPYWYGSCGSKGLDNWRERTARDLVEAEIFACLGSLMGLHYPVQQIDMLWQNKLTLDPHDGLYVGDQDLMDLIDVGRQVGYECQQLCDQSMERISHRIGAEVGKQAIGLFNPLNWTRREAVEVQAVFAVQGIRRVKVVDDEGHEIPHQLLKVRHMGRQAKYYKEAWMLLEAEVPALGYTTLYIEPEEGSEEASNPETPVNVLESRRLKLRLGKSGIESLEDSVRGVEYLGAGNPAYYSQSARTGESYYGGCITGQEGVRDALWRLIEEGSLRSTAEMHGWLGAHHVGLRVSLYHTLDRIDFLLTVDSAGGNGYFAAQVPFDYAGSLYAGIPFGAEIRDLTKEPFGPGAGEERRRENVFFAHHWVDYSDGQKGLTLVAAEGKRGFHFDPKTRTLGHILLMTITPLPISNDPGHDNLAEMENFFANRYFQGTGTHSFGYSLIPHSGDWKAAGSLLRAQERLYPVHWKHVHPLSAADLPLHKSFLTVTPQTVVLSSWQWQADGYHLRLYETRGEAGGVEVKLPFEAAECEPVDLNGKQWKAVRVEHRGDIVRFQIRPWEIVTLRFKPIG
jgi:alpha-mannosidase